MGGDPGVNSSGVLGPPCTTDGSPNASHTLSRISCSRSSGYVFVPLFPAIVENHLTLGAGYAFNKASDVNFSMTYAPEVEVTSPTAGKISHAQMNWQMMYSHRF